MLISQFDRTPARKSTLVTKGSGVSMRDADSVQNLYEWDANSIPYRRIVYSLFSERIGNYGFPRDSGTIGPAGRSRRALIK